MTPTLEQLLGTENRKIPLPQSPSVAGSLAVTALRGLGGAGYFVGLVLFLGLVLQGARSTELVLGPVSIDWTVVLAGGVLLWVSSSVLYVGLFAFSNRRPRPAPTLTLLLFELSVFVGAIQTFSLGTHLQEPTVIGVAILTFPIGIAYMGWAWNRLIALGDRFGSLVLIVLWPYLVTVTPIGILTVVFPRIGLGVGAGLFAGNVVVRGYRDLRVPLKRRQNPPDGDTADPSLVDAILSVARQGVVYACLTLGVIWALLVFIFFVPGRGTPPAAEQLNISTILGYDPGQFLLGLGGIVGVLCLSMRKLLSIESSDSGDADRQHSAVER